MDWALGCSGCFPFVMPGGENSPWVDGRVLDSEEDAHLNMTS
jgi:hypothetical protein